MKTIGFFLKQSMEKQNITVDELSLKTKFSKEFIEGVLNNKIKPNKEIIDSFSEALNLNPEEAYLYNTQKNKNSYKLFYLFNLIGIIIFIITLIYSLSIFSTLSYIKNYNGALTEPIYLPRNIYILGFFILPFFVLSCILPTRGTINFAIKEYDNKTIIYYIYLILGIAVVVILLTFTILFLQYLPSTKLLK